MGTNIIFHLNFYWSHCNVSRLPHLHNYVWVSLYSCRPGYDIPVMEPTVTETILNADEEVELADRKGLAAGSFASSYNPYS